MNTILTPSIYSAKHVWVVAGLMALVLVLSFVFFEHQSLRLDEAQSLWQTSHTPSRILNLIAEDVHVPLYHMILHFWQSLFGSTVMAARILSLLFFILSIPVLYTLGRRSFSPRVSLFATTMYAISPFMNWYGNEIRMYTLFVFITLLHQYFFVRLFRRSANEQLSGIWAGFAVTSVLGIYTHYFFALILMTNALFFLFNRPLFPERSFRKMLASGIVVCVSFIPWVLYVYALGQASNTRPTLQPPTSINVFNTFSQFVFGFQTDHLNTIFLSMWPLTVLLGFMALRRNKKLSPQTIYFILGFILPNVLAFVVSFIYRPVYLTRYLIIALPSMYLFLSWLILSYPKVLSITLRYAIITIMIVTLMTEAVSAATPVKENYKDAAMYLEQHAEPTDVLVVSSPFTIYPMLYYYKGPMAIDTLPRWDRSRYGPIPAFSVDTLEKEVGEIKGDHRNLWILLSYDQGYHKDILNYLDSTYQQLDKQEFSPGMTLYKYKLRYDVDVIEVQTQGVSSMP